MTPHKNKSYYEDQDQPLDGSQAEEPIEALLQGQKRFGSPNQPRPQASFNEAWKLKKEQAKQQESQKEAQPELNGSHMQHINVLV